MYQVNEIKAIIKKMVLAVIENKDYLGELDGKSGDGDLGLSMEAAFNAIWETVSSYEGASISEMMMIVSMNCNKAAPSTMGTLISAGIMAVAKAAKGKSGFEPEDVVQLPGIVAEAMMKRGGAKLGDKTILDALCPMAKSVEEQFALTGSLKEAFAAGAETAKASAEATRGMHAGVGRAKWLGDRAAENLDGGAVLCSLIAAKLVE